MIFHRHAFKPVCVLPFSLFWVEEVGGVLSTVMIYAAEQCDCGARRVHPAAETCPTQIKRVAERWARGLDIGEKPEDCFIMVRNPVEVMEVREYERRLAQAFPDPAPEPERPIIERGHLSLVSSR